MRKNPKNHIKISTFHKNLVLRLILIGLIISFIAGSIAWLKERNRIGDAIYTRAIIGASSFNLYIDDLIKAPDWPNKKAVGL